MHSLILHVIFFTCICYKLNAQTPHIGNDTIQVLPIAFKDDRSYGIWSYEKFVARYDNRSLFILDSRENIDTVIDAWLNSRNIANYAIKEQMFDTRDTVVESKSVEKWMKSLRRKRVLELSEELLSRFYPFIDTTKPTLLIYNEFRWRDRLINSTKNNVNYRVYAVVFKNREVIRFYWMRDGTKEETARKKEQNLYPVLLDRLFDY